MNQVSWHVAVLIPARNEEDLLPRCLQSVVNACNYLPTTCTTEIILVVDSATDRSAEIGQALLNENGTVIEINSANVGIARATGANVVLNHYKGSLNRCWLANTDADSEVPCHWLVDQLLLAEQGYEGLAGIIDIDSFIEHEAHVPERFRLTYLLQPDGTHTHVHGANLGVRADAYLQAGGWGKQQTAEDHHLWRRLQQQESRLLATSQICVTTSGRRMGRAPNGFAETLGRHNELRYDYV